MADGFYGHDYGHADIGTSTVGGLTYDDVQKTDGDALPDALQLRGLHQPDPGPIPFARYFDPAYFALEVEHLWKKRWQVACREEDIPNVGDRTIYEVVGMSFVVVHVAEDSYKAYWNVCPHRGRALCDGKGNGEHLRCNFHGWTWNNDGSLAWIPSQQDFPHVQPQNYGLREVRLGRWGGQIFINPSPTGPSLEDELGPLPAHFRQVPLENRFTALHLKKKMRVNWKAAQEAFMEAYHLAETHWDAMPFTSDTGTRYDCYDGEHYAFDRLISATAVPSALLGGKVGPRESLIAYLRANALPYDVPEGRGESVEDARAYATEIRRATVAALTGKDQAEASATLLLDAVKYFVYPNFHPWWGEGLPLWYRFLPIGMSPDECVMEIRYLLPVPEGQPRPAPAATIELGFDDLCKAVPELLFLGTVLDQDMDNLPRVQDGLKAMPAEGAFLTIARVQESEIAHFHEVYARDLKLEKGK